MQNDEDSGESRNWHHCGKILHPSTGFHKSSMCQLYPGLKIFLSVRYTSPGVEAQGIKTFIKGRIVRAGSFRRTPKVLAIPRIMNYQLSNEELDPRLQPSSGKSREFSLVNEQLIAHMMPECYTNRFPGWSVASN
ncbi:hypothetical protein Ac2012v2_007747 [Leucoagaricus gongylophorus]